jgi:hypothetical protein
VYAAKRSAALIARALEEPDFAAELDLAADSQSAFHA